MVAPITHQILKVPAGWISIYIPKTIPICYFLSELAKCSQTLILLTFFADMNFFPFGI